MPNSVRGDLQHAAQGRHFQVVELAGREIGGAAADSKKATSNPALAIAWQSTAWFSASRMSILASCPGYSAASMQRSLILRKLNAIENGPPTGTRTSASGNSRLMRCATDISIAIRPSRPGSNGLRLIPSSIDASNGLWIAGIPSRRRFNLRPIRLGLKIVNIDGYRDHLLMIFQVASAMGLEQ